MVDNAGSEAFVRVATRVRPILPKEKLAGDDSCVKVLPETKQILIAKDKSFTFDYVFSPKATQREVYDTCVRQLISDVFEGYNSTVFAYGQTGSGKTYTMGTTSQESLEQGERGIIFHAIEDIFTHVSTRDCHVNVTLFVSFIEIYKEEIRDLLDPTGGKEIHIREDEHGNTLISGVTERPCENAQDLFDQLELGASNRVTGATQMNEFSSRSHCVFTITVLQEWPDSPSPTLSKTPIPECDSSSEATEVKHCISGKFHFVDLAGSERARKTGNRGDRLKESIHINTGLLALGNVISSLGDPSKRRVSHIPYRESKITRILKDSLGGNARTLMICCISPAWSNCDESVNALNYANRARNIRNKPVVNRDRVSMKIEKMQMEIANLRAQLSRRQTSLQDVNTSNSDPTSYATLSHYRLLCEQYSVLVLDAIALLQECMATISNSHSQSSMGENTAPASPKVSQLTSVIQNWLEQADEITNLIPATLDKEKWENVTIQRLQDELKQVRRDLCNDVEIFTEKNKELSSQNEIIAELQSQLRQCENHIGKLEDRCQQQENLLVEQQRQLQKLQHQTRAITSQPPDAANADPQKSNNLDRRVKSGSAQRANSGLRKSVLLDIMTARDIKTSPALFSIERVIEGFRARSQILASRWEDDDGVSRVEFHDDLDEVSSSHALQENICNTDNELGNFHRVGTYKLGKGVENVAQNTKEGDSKSKDEDEEAHRESEAYRKKIKLSQLRLAEAHQKMRDLAINIRLKEQLIKELVKSSKDTQTLNQNYERKIKGLEIEKHSANKEIVDLQSKLNDIQGEESQEIRKIRESYERKIQQKQKVLEELRRKQLDTERLAVFSMNHEKKIQDLMVTIEKMKQDQINVQKRLKEESEKKMRLEKELQKEQERIRNLEIKTEHQQKILKRKQEEIVAVHKRLRHGSLGGESVIDRQVEEQKRILDEESEKLMEQRRNMEILEAELRQRELILSKKETALVERAEIEMKRLRQSHQLDKDYVTVSGRLNETEQELLEKQKTLPNARERDRGKVEREIEELRQERDQWQQKRRELEKKLQKGTLLNEMEERRLIELDVAVETLDRAIQCKDDGIRKQQQLIKEGERTLAMSSENLFLQLRNLDASEAQYLLMEYFKETVKAREALHLNQSKIAELEVQGEEMQRISDQLQRSLEHQMVEMDRKLTQQQKSYEEEIGILVQQLANMGGVSPSNAGKGIGVTEAAINQRFEQVEKELLATKKANREMKRKIREWVLSGRLVASDIDIGVNETPRPASHSQTPRTQRGTYLPSGNGPNADVPLTTRSHLGQENSTSSTVTPRMPSAHYQPTHYSTEESTHPDVAMSKRTPASDAKSHMTEPSNREPPTREQQSSRQSQLSSVFDSLEERGTPRK